MRRYLLLAGLLTAMVGCHSAYKEMEPGDRVALLNDKAPPPTSPAWTQTHSAPLAYRSPVVSANANNSFTPGTNAGTAPKLNRPFNPTSVASAQPGDKPAEPAPVQPRLTPAPSVQRVGFETKGGPGGLGTPVQEFSTSLRPIANDKNDKKETGEPPMAPGTPPRQFPPLDNVVKPVKAEEPVEKVVNRPSNISGPAVRMVNSKRVSLNYELKDVGPSGVSAIEMYVTRDGKEWAKDEKALKSGPPYIYEVDEEGMYGFTIVARSGLGLGKTPPKPGDTPQVWVEVDLSRPEVRIQDVKHGLGVKAREVTINWSATDRNLTRRPVTLLYSEKPDGPWTPIAANIENTGNYVWQSPTNGPTQFFVRAEAVDLVGNIGVAQTSKPLLIDMSQPTVSILNVEPASK